MTSQERRKRPRGQSEIGDSTFIEMRHTFGPLRKSVYKVLEYDEYGMSFLIPAQDGYFRPGSPMEYCLVKPDLTKLEAYGTVRYYHPYNDHTGNAFYKVGLENKSLGKDKLPANLRIRPERVRLSDLSSPHAIYFSAGDREYSLPLVDISRYSAAFHCEEEDALSLAVSTALDGVEITFGAKTMFEGTVIVTRRTLEEEKYRIVVEPRNAVFDIYVIEEQETLTELTRSVETLVSASNKHQTIDPAFKGAIADMRAFLEGYRNILDMPMTIKLSNEMDQVAFLEELYGTFNSQMDEYFIKIDRIVAALNLDEHQQGLYKSYFQAHFHPLLMGSPFCHRMYFKPLGYPGDYEMMRMLRENSFEGPTLFAKMINKVFLETPLGKANRNRVAYLADRIGRFVEEHGGEEVRLLSIASGPALEIQQLIEKRPEIAGRVHLTLLDQEAEALRYSQDAIYIKRIMLGSSIRVELIHQSIGSFLKQLARRSWRNLKFDLVYIFGLFDYFDDRTCSFCIKRSADLVKDGGMMLVSNYSLDGHEHHTFLEYAFEWYMLYRDNEQMKQLGLSTGLPCKMTVDEDPSGVIKFLELQFDQERKRPRRRRANEPVGQ